MRIVYKRLMACFCAMLCLVGVWNMSHSRVYAAVVDLNVQVSSTEVEVGDWVTVTLRFRSNEDLAGAYARITYNPNLLEYTSGDAEGDTGSLMISSMEAEVSTTLEYTLNFTALAEGSASIEVAESALYDEQAQSLGSPTGSQTIQINAQGTLSSDATLQSLMVSYGNLEPAFSANVMEYTMTVPNRITSVTITPVASDPTAAVQVSGVSELAVGENTRQVTIIAPDGTTNVYTIHITREAAEDSAQDSSSAENSSGAEESSKEESSETEESSQEDSSKEESSGESYGTISFRVDGLTMYLQSIPQNAEIPRGFEKISYAYQRENFDVAQTPDQSLTLFYLADFRGENGAFYLYDPAADTCYNSIPLYSNGHVQILLNADQGGRVPKGCALETAVIDGHEIRVYVAGGLSAQDAREYIVYAMGEDGAADYYRYDVRSGTMGYYMDDFESGEEEAGTSSDSEESQALPVNSNGGNGNSGGTFGGIMRYTPYILLALILMTLILIIVIVLLARSYRKRRMRDDELQYDQRAEIDPTEEAEEPEDPEDIQLDSDAFDKWKEATQRIPVMKMTEVQTTTIEAVTGMIPVLESTQNLSETVAAAQETKVVPEEIAEKEDMQEPSEEEDAPQETENPQTEEDAYKPLTPEEFFL